jgi:hypothetical protein
MSLYNQLFGVNPYAGLLMDGRKWPPIPRFRDVYISTDHRLVVLTRTGGGNRPQYAKENAAMCYVPGYIGNEDALEDDTYAHFYYSPPPGLNMPEILRKQGHRGMPAFQAVFDDLRLGNDTPQTQRAKAYAQELIRLIEAAKENGSGCIVVET